MTSAQMNYFFKSALSYLQLSSGPDKHIGSSGFSNLPILLRELPLDGDIWSRRGSMKGVKDEEDLCLDIELLSDWD